MDQHEVDTIKLRSLTQKDKAADIIVVDPSKTDLDVAVPAGFDVEYHYGKATLDLMKAQAQQWCRLQCWMHSWPRFGSGSTSSKAGGNTKKSKRSHAKPASMRLCSAYSAEKGIQQKQ